MPQTVPPLVDVVFPCLNEAAALPGLLTKLPPGYRAIVVDNGSTDRSAEVATSFGALVIFEPRKGFGAAAHAGLLAATASIVAFCDADGSMEPGDIPSLVGPIFAGEADFVLGNRKPTKVTAWPLHARLANRVLVAIINRKLGLRLKDLGPMRAIVREKILTFDLQDRRNGYPLEMLIQACAHKLTILEVPIKYSPRVGKSKVTGTIKGTWYAVQDMSKLLQRIPSASSNSSQSLDGKLDLIEEVKQ